MNQFIKTIFCAEKPSWVYMIPNMMKSLPCLFYLQEFVAYVGCFVFSNYIGDNKPQNMHFSGQSLVRGKIGKNLHRLSQFSAASNFSVTDASGVEKNLWFLLMRFFKQKNCFFVGIACHTCHRSWPYWSNVKF